MGIQEVSGKMKKTAIILVIISVISKIIGFIRDLILSYFYGVSYISDAYLVANTVINVLFGFVITAISTSYIPIYKNIENKSGKKKADLYTGKLTGFITILATILFFVGMFFTEGLVKVFASGFDVKAFNLTVQFLKISIFSLYFVGLVHLYSSFLQVQGKYIVTLLIGFPLNIVTIIFIYLSSEYDVLFLAVGTVIAVLAQVILLIPFVLKNSSNKKSLINFNFNDENIKKTIVVSLPIILGVSINEINVIIDRSIASNITIGGISALNYASLLNIFVMGVFVTPILTILFPTLSGIAANKEMDVFKRTVNGSVLSVALLVIPACVGLIVLAEPIIKILFGRGAFDDKAISMTASALIFYSVGLIGFSMREVLSRAFYALQDTKTPAVNAAIAVGINIILNLILSVPMGINGLALATSISGIVCALLLMINLKNKIGSYKIKELFISLMKVLIASILMGLVVIQCNIFMDGILYEFLQLCISLVIGIVVYIILILNFKITEAKEVVEKLINLVNKSR